MSDEKNKKVLSFNTNEALHTVFVDHVSSTIRTDGMHLLRFYTALPEGLQEQSRMMIPKESMKRMLDVLCKHCDHFPEKSSPKEALPSKPS